MAISDDRADLARGPLNAATDLKLLLGTVDREPPAAHCCLVIYSSSAFKCVSEIVNVEM